MAKARKVKRARMVEKARKAAKVTRGSCLPF
jgi:hypothetical protein